jgi:hypothetical protein
MHRTLSNISGFQICKFPTLFFLNFILISITNLENPHEVFCINLLFVDKCIVSKGFLPFLPQLNLRVELSDSNSNSNSNSKQLKWRFGGLKLAAMCKAGEFFGVYCLMIIKIVF